MSDSTPIDLKDVVRRAIREEWPAFAASHPRLAEVVDETILTEGALASLGADEEYQTTMQQASAAGVAADVIGNVVLRYVTRWLRELI